MDCPLCLEPNALVFHPQSRYTNCPACDVSFRLGYDQDLEFGEDCDSCSGSGVGGPETRCAWCRGRGVRWRALDQS